MIWLLACATDRAPSDSSASGPAPAAPNVLLVLLDDFGVEQIPAYGARPGQPRTPTLDQLAADGTLFRNAYANAECSPTRAAVLTGRFGRRTGVGSVIDLDDGFWLEDDPRTLPKVLAERGFSSSQAGKWHLGGGPVLLTHPASSGFGWFAGSLENLGVSLGVVAEPGYALWEKNTNGVLAPSATYATTDTTDDALDRTRTMPEPWLAWVAYNAAHSPYEAPPEALLQEPLADGAEREAVHGAMLEALDAELGRLLAGLPGDVRDRTHVIVMGDNGSPVGLSLGVFDPSRSKNTVYEGGIHVPLIVSGPGVAAGGTTDTLVHAVDVYATVLDLAGAAPEPGGDGVSFAPFLADPNAAGGRSYVWSEKFEPNGHGTEVHSTRAIRDESHKLVRTRHPGTDVSELFALDSSTFDEGPDLAVDGLSAEESEILDRLTVALDDAISALDTP